MPIPRTLALLTIGLLALAHLPLTPVARAQEAATSTDTEAATQAMEPLAWMTGDWAGEGWIQRGPGERHEFEQTEHIEPAFGGRLLLVEGIGRTKVPGGEGSIVHHAYGVLSWDVGEDRYRFDTYRAGERGLVADAMLADGVLTWGFDAPNGKIRFHIRETGAGQWHETGEFSPDGGTTWHPFFEMTLQRVEGSVVDPPVDAHATTSDR